MVYGLRYNDVFCRYCIAFHRRCICVLVIYFNDMFYMKLWSLLSSSALISVNHTGKLVTLHLLTKEWHTFCSQHSLIRQHRTETNISELQIHSNVKYGKLLISFRNPINRSITISDGQITYQIRWNEIKSKYLNSKSQIKSNHDVNQMTTVPY